MKNEQGIHQYEKKEDEMILGVSSLTSDHLLCTEQIISIEICVNESKRISMYLNDGVSLKILNFLNDYFLPFVYDRKIEILLTETNQNFILSDINSPSFLGANTYI